MDNGGGQYKSSHEAVRPLNINVIQAPKLEWTIVHNPETDYNFGLYWASASCECGLILSTHVRDKEHLLERELAEEMHHFAFRHDELMRRKLRREIRLGQRGPVDCECCGYHGLRNPFVVEGHVVGTECRHHIERFPCRGRIKLD